MKKIIKNPIFTFIIGLALATVVGVYAINANEITYSDTTVDQALNTVYSSLNNKIVLNTFGTAEYNASYGKRLASRDTTLTLDAGKYIILVIGSTSGGGSGGSNTYRDIQENIVCSTECDKTYLSGKEIQGYGSQWNSYFKYSMYICTINEDDTTVTYTSTSSSNNQFGQSVLMSAIPINE